jgi:hypothetical protein
VSAQTVRFLSSRGDDVSGVGADETPLQEEDIPF